MSDDILNSTRSRRKDVSEKFIMVMDAQVGYAKTNKTHQIKREGRCSSLFFSYKRLLHTSCHPVDTDMGLDVHRRAAGLTAPPPIQA